VGEDETAMGGRNAAHNLYAFWAHEFMGAMEPFTIPGVSLNFSADHRENKIKAFFGPEKYEQLVALKDKYDPVNLYRLNQNIIPSQELPHPVS
jgi:hypothetical protein